MLTAIEKLREYCERKKYKDVANLISAFDELTIYFKKYDNVAQIVDLYKEKDSLVLELKKQIKEDFLAFYKKNSNLNEDSMSEACLVVEALGINFKNEIVKFICQIVLEPYNKTFASDENSSLENTERRYGWLWRTWKEFDMIFNNVFPLYWGIQCSIFYEFCGDTRVQTTRTLEIKSNNTDVAVLMKALQTTLKFESKVSDDMKKKYKIYLEENHEEECKKDKINKELKISSLPKFKGLKNLFIFYLFLNMINNKK